MNDDFFATVFLVLLLAWALAALLAAFLPRRLLVARIAYWIFLAPLLVATFPVGPLLYWGYVAWTRHREERREELELLRRIASNSAAEQTPDTPSTDRA